MLPPLGTHISIQDGLQCIRYGPALAIMDHVHGVQPVHYHSRITQRNTVLFRSRIQSYVVRLDDDEPYPRREDKPPCPTGCGGYLDRSVCGDYLFLLGIFYVTCRVSLLAAVTPVE